MTNLTPFFPSCDNQTIKNQPDATPSYPTFQCYTFLWCGCPWGPGWWVIKCPLLTSRWSHQVNCSGSSGHRGQSPAPLHQQQPASGLTVIIIIFLFKCMAKIFLKASCKVRQSGQMCFFSPFALRHRSPWQPSPRHFRSDWTLNSCVENDGNHYTSVNMPDQLLLSSFSLWHKNWLFEDKTLPSSHFLIKNTMRHKNATIEKINIQGETGPSSGTFINQQNYPPNAWGHGTKTPFVLTGSKWLTPSPTAVETFSFLSTGLLCSVLFPPNDRKQEAAKAQRG